MNHKEVMANWSSRSRTCRLLCAAAAIAGASACGSSTAPPASPTPTPTTLRADVTDPAGDAASDSRVAVAPDLLRATATAENGNLTLVVSFVPGTFDRQTTRVAVLLDTDQNPATGIRQPDGLGADFALDLFPAAAQAIVRRADEAGCAARQACFVDAGAASISILGDGVQAVVPLAAIGAASGRVSFQLNAYVTFPPLASVTFDFLPDASLAPARVQ
jgi:hypothetical protein